MSFDVPSLLVGASILLNLLAGPPFIYGMYRGWRECDD